MSDPAQRFTSRVDSYVKYRPGYPSAVVDLLREECGLTKHAVVADVGSGTGILAEMLLKNGNGVFGVEPNQAMRERAEQLLSSYPRFSSVAGTAEATNLPTSSVDLITAAQAFHWFDLEHCRPEFCRILKRDGFVALMWNDRRLDTTQFLRDYETLLQTFGTDYREVSQVGNQATFFSPNSFQVKRFPNVQLFDLEGLKGRVFSSSYTPEPGQPNFEPMVQELERIFGLHQQGGKVAFEYDTLVYYGRLH